MGPHADLPTDGVSNPILLDPWDSDPSHRLPTEPQPTCCPRLASATEYGVSYDSTATSLDKPSSKHRLRSNVESGHADYCWHQTILSSDLSIGSHCATQTGSHSTLGGSARLAALGCPAVFQAAGSAQSSSTA